MTIGQPVMIDPSNAGRVRAATSGGSTASAGVAVYEYISTAGLDPNLVGQGDQSEIPVGAYAQVVHGPGVKIWLRSTPAKTLYDGRTQAAYNPFDAAVTLGTLAIGAQLSPNGSGKWKVSNGTTDANWLTVESVNATTGLVEARFNF